MCSIASTPEINGSEAPDPRRSGATQRRRSCRAIDLVEPHPVIEGKSVHEHCQFPLPSRLVSEGCFPDLYVSHARPPMISRHNRHVPYGRNEATSDPHDRFPRDRACTEATTSGTTAPGIAAHVVNVPDGDSLVVKVDGIEEKVRLIGVNAPEHDECFGEESAARPA